MSARAFIILAMVVAVSKVQADTSLRGVVLSNELGGPPMGNVEISAVAGNPNNTGTDGKFTFTFPNRNPGDTVRLIVRKEGYVVVNDIQLELTLPADPEERPAIILLCKEGDREEMARRFYRLKSVEAIDETYKKKLEEAQHASAAELAKLRQQRDQAKEAAEKVAEGLAKQNPGGSELYRTAMRLFLDGKVDQALDALNDEKLRELSRAAKERKAEAEKAIEEAIQNWLLKAQLFTVRFRFDDAEKAYQEAMDTSPDSFKAIFAFAAFNQQLNRYDKARSAYKRCLELARPKENKSDVASTLNGLANLDRDENWHDAARKEYEEALKLRRELAKENPDTYLPDVATTLNGLGNFDSDENRREAARTEYEEALKLRRELAKKNPDTYLPDVARSLNNLAILDEHWKPREARNEYEEALKIARELAAKNPDTYLPDVAMTLTNLTSLDQRENRQEEARKQCEEAVKIYRELAKKNPDTYLPNMAIALNNVAALDRNENRREEARKKYEEALKIDRELAKKNPDTYLPEVALTLNNLAILDLDENRREAARKEFEEALVIYERFAERNSEKFQSEVARVKHLLQRLSK